MFRFAAWMPPHSLYTRIPQRFSLPSVLVSLRPSAYSVSFPSSNSPWSPPAPPIYRILYATINITGNLITLLALLKSPTIREHATTAFVISLSISDLLFCSFSLPLTAVRFFQEVRMNFNSLATLITVSSPHRVGPLAAPCAKSFPSSSMAM